MQSAQLIYVRVVPWGRQKCYMANMCCFGWCVGIMLCRKSVNNFYFYFWELFLIYFILYY